MAEHIGREDFSYLVSSLTEGDRVALGRDAEQPTSFRVSSLANGDIRLVMNGEGERGGAGNVVVVNADTFSGADIEEDCVIIRTTTPSDTEAVRAIGEWVTNRCE